MQTNSANHHRKFRKQTLRLFWGEIAVFVLASFFLDAPCSCILNINVSDIFIMLTSYKKRPCSGVS